MSGAGFSYQEGVCVIFVRASIDPGRAGNLVTPPRDNLTAEA
jgi:hypothetical protein